jgi:hypothetical protein
MGTPASSNSKVKVSRKRYASPFGTFASLRSLRNRVCRLRTMLSSFSLSLQKKNFSVTFGVASNADKTNPGRIVFTGTSENGRSKITAHPQLTRKSTQEAWKARIFASKRLDNSRSTIQRLVFHQSEALAVSIKIVPASVLFRRSSSSPRLYHNSRKRQIYALRQT